MAHLRQLDRSEWPRWDAYVAQHAQGTLFHTTKWLQHTGEDVLVWSWEHQGTISGGFATVPTKGRLRILRYVKPPYTPYHFPLFGTGKNDSATEKYVFYKALLKQLEGVRIIAFDFSPGHHNMLPFHWAGFDTRFRLTNLVAADHFDDYLASLSKDYRKYYRRIHKQLDSGNLILEEHSNLQAILDLYKRIAEKRGFSYSTTFVEKVFLAQYNPEYLYSLSLKERASGKVLSGIIAAHDQHAYYFLLGGNDKQFSGAFKHVNVLNVALVIKRAIEEGKTFDFEGSMLPGVEAFNRHLGGVPTPVYHLRRITPPLLNAAFAYFRK
jgi:hypothetical protein